MNKLNLLWHVFVAKDVILMTATKRKNFMLRHNVRPLDGARLSDFALTKFTKDRFAEVTLIKQRDYLEVYKEVPEAMEKELTAMQQFINSKNQRPQQQMKPIDTTQPALPQGKEIPLKQNVVQNSIKQK